MTYGMCGECDTRKHLSPEGVCSQCVLERQLASEQGEIERAQEALAIALEWAEWIEVVSSDMEYDESCHSQFNIKREKIRRALAALEQIVNQREYRAMKLSDRLRPNTEAAPWAIEEIKKLEDQNQRLEMELAEVDALLNRDATPVGNYSRLGRMGIWAARHYQSDRSRKTLAQLETENQRLREVVPPARKWMMNAASALESFAKTIKVQESMGLEQYAGFHSHWVQQVSGELQAHYAELGAALSQPAEQQNAAGDWHCQNCGYIVDQRVTFQETCDTCHQPVEWHVADQQGRIEDPKQETPAPVDDLPLMARREWMPDWAVELGWSTQGLCHPIDKHGTVYTSLAEGTGRQKHATYRIADTDEHGLPVIERTAEMPEWAKYARANFYRQFTREHQTWMQVKSGWRRIEDYNAREA